MSKKIKKFTAFGVSYETQQHSAVFGSALIGGNATASPIDLLSTTFVVTSDQRRIQLDSRESINELVVDKANIICPNIVLRGILSIIHEFNFKFIESWRGVKVPRRFYDDAQSIKSDNLDPMISQIIQEGSATLKELEDYYSTEDAFKLFDAIMVKGVNAALSHEASMKKIKKG